MRAEAESTQETPRKDPRSLLRRWVHSERFQTGVMVLICANAVTLGIETFDISNKSRAMLHVLDLFFVVIFSVELVLRIGAGGVQFFRSSWNVVDALIIIGGVLSASNLFAALRAFRVLRLLRIVTAIPRMRTVVKALTDAVPGIISVAVVAILVCYIFAVIAGSLYGSTHPHFFGDVFTAMYTLFQIITLEGWRDIADEVQADHPSAWLFFVVFVLIGTFTMLNLFIAIVVQVVEEEVEETEELMREEADLVLLEIRKLSDKVDGIEKRLTEDR